jgi:hypothetical protein
MVLCDRCCGSSTDKAMTFNQIGHSRHQGLIGFGLEFQPSRCMTVKKFSSAESVIPIAPSSPISRTHRFHPEQTETLFIEWIRDVSVSRRLKTGVSEMHLRLVLQFGGEKEELNFFERFMDMNILRFFNIALTSSISLQFLKISDLTCSSLCSPNRRRK